MNEKLLEGIIEEIKYQVDSAEGTLKEHEILSIAYAIVFDEKFNMDMMNIIREKIKLLRE